MHKKNEKLKWTTSNKEYKIAKRGMSGSHSIPCLVCMKRIGKGYRRLYQSWTCDNWQSNWYRKPKSWKRWRSYQAHQRL